MPRPRRSLGLGVALVLATMLAAHPAVATPDASTGARGGPSEPAGRGQVASERGADLVYTAISGDQVTDCQEMVHVSPDGTAGAPLDIGCPGQPVRAVHAGIRSLHIGEYGPDAPMGLWGPTGTLLGAVRGSRDRCFTTGGDSDWRLLCSPTSPSTLVTAYGLARSEIWLLSLSAAPRSVAVVPYLAGAVVSQDGGTLHAWTAVGPDTFPRPARKVRATVRDVDLATGRQQVRARAPKGRMYDIVCATWDGTVIASTESWRRYGNRQRHGLVTISPAGRVQPLPVGYPTQSETVGCSADGRVLIWLPADWNDERTLTYDVTTGITAVAATTRVDLVDNS